MIIYQCLIRGSIRVLIFPLIAVSIVVTGCGGPGPPPPEGQIAIEKVAKWYQLYKADNRRPPKDEAEFVAFIEKKLSERGETVPEQLLTSPRDEQTYVIQYGKTISPSMDRNVAVYEQEGYRGKKLVAFEAAWSEEVDDAQLQALLAGRVDDDPF